MSQLSPTLLAALSAVIAFEALIAWAFHPHGLGTLRAVLLLGTMLITALLSTAVSRLAAGTLPLAGAGAPFGWKLYILAAGVGLLAYAGVDHEPGPAYIGVSRCCSRLQS